ncbi:YebC/PmpR family DNA-binding transcriptional regulator [Proteinivorax hydrogeniformans]|uniref:Probable transcriptional regulatory protein PRVXH_001995 n=1 Tax=Proteinivorax hydrogeniformans TaxID=1826727 RepID=A0AAU8HSC2_9FIRM
MAGHSKWANIKHKKSRQDAQRGKIFTKISKEIMVAVQQGGTDADTNFKLRLAIQKAKSNNMPNDNIERAIKRGTGDLDGKNFEEIVYEGYGPGGAAVMLDILTDNRNRTAGEIRHIFSKNNGNLGESGCVSWMFHRKGLFVVEKNDEVEEDELLLVALEAGAEDVKSTDEIFQITCEPEEFETVKKALEDNDYKLEVEEVSMVPENTVSLSESDLEKMEKLEEVLDDHNDVQNIYTNVE